MLLGAKNPGILAGSRVVERNAVDELARLAERLGAPVIGESGTTHGRLAFPPHHPLYDQCLPLWSPEIRERLRAWRLQQARAEQIAPFMVFSDATLRALAALPAQRVDERTLAMVPGIGPA